jgi:hypothetical protein
MSEKNKTAQEIEGYKANLIRAREEILPVITRANETQLNAIKLTYKDDGKLTHHYELATKMIGGADLIKRLIEDLVVEEIAKILSTDNDGESKKTQINDLRFNRIPYLAIDGKQPAFCINESDLSRLNLITTEQARAESTSLGQYAVEQRGREHVTRCLIENVRPMILAKGKEMGLTDAQSELLVTRYFYTTTGNSTLIMQRLIAGDELAPPLEDILNEKFAEGEQLIQQGWVKATQLSKELGLNPSTMTMNIRTIREAAAQNCKDPDSLAKICACKGTRTETYLISLEGREALVDLRKKIEINSKSRRGATDTIPTQR